MSHPDEGLIHAWLDGELDAAEAARVAALVEADAEWAAAAAEARGLIAASARIVGALDRVPANVVPKAPLAKPAPRRWAWRAAAVLALMAGSAVVLEREKPELPARPASPGALTAKAAAPAVPPANSTATATRAPAAHQPRAQVAKAEPAGKPAPRAPAPDSAKLAGAALDKDLAAVSADTRAKAAAVPRDEAGASAAERRAGNAPMAAAAQPSAQVARASAPAPAAAGQNFAPSRLTRLPTSCFQQLEPHDSTAGMIRLSAAALEDSIRLETLVLRGGGDTLAAVHGRFIAVRVRCPAP